MKTVGATLSSIGPGGIKPKLPARSPDREVDVPGIGPVPVWIERSAQGEARSAIVGPLGTQIPLGTATEASTTVQVRRGSKTVTLEIESSRSTLKLNGQEVGIRTTADEALSPAAHPRAGAEAPRIDPATKADAVSKPRSRRTLLQLARVLGNRDGGAVDYPALARQARAEAERMRSTPASLRLPVQAPLQGHWRWPLEVPPYAARVDPYTAVRLSLALCMGLPLAMLPVLWANPAPLAGASWV